MKDPFQPNPKDQLIREAQVGFVIIGLLLCVLVYVALHRFAGRHQRYEELAQNAPVAKAIGPEPYYAETIIEHEQEIDRRLEDDPELKQKLEGAGTRPQQPKIGGDLFKAIAQLTQAARPDAQTVAAKPTVDAATAAPPTSVTPGAFEPQVVKSRTPRSFVAEIPVAKMTGNAVGQPQVKAANENSDFEKRTVKPRPQPVVESLRPVSQLPPVLQSEFGAGMKEDPELSLSTIKPTEPAPISPSPAEADSFVVDEGRDVEKNRDVQRPQVETASAFEPLPTPMADSSIAVASFEAENARSDDDTANALNGIGDVKRYTVQTGDSLWTIAQEFYGDGSWFRALFEHNRVRIGEAGGVVIGFALEIPEPQELSRKFPQLSPVSAPPSERQSQNASGLTTTAMIQKLDSEMEQRYHLTQDGETLFEIARQRLGQASRYLEIQELNQFRLPEKVNHLTPLKRGVRLLLPE